MDLEFRFLKKLINIPSPSGFEGTNVREWLKYTRPYSHKYYTDKVQGNAFCMLEGKGPSIMLVAHIDEVGMMVNYIDEDGFISMKQIGGLDPAILPGQSIIIQGKKGNVGGVISRVAVHMLSSDEEGEVPKIHELIVDIGANSREDALSYVRIGSPATINSGFRKLKNGLIVGRAFDNRAGAWVVAQAMRKLYDYKDVPSVYSVITTNEENGAYGAKTITNYIKPDIAIVVDATHATDTPGVDKTKHGDVSINDVSISTGSLLNTKIVNELCESAEDQDIQYVREAAPRWTGTDADEVAIQGTGVSTGLISYPVRYMHTPVEVLQYETLFDVVDVIVGFIKKVSLKCQEEKL